MSSNHALVVVFLRGGADGLALVPPIDDGRLHAIRPTLALPRDKVRAIDDRHGLHPSLEPLRGLIDAGDLSMTLAAGSDDSTRSHFEAQERMEMAGEESGTMSSGWIARHLSTRRGPPVGPLAAAAFGAMVPESLRGVSATALERVADLVPEHPDAAALDALDRLYRSSGIAADRLPLGRELADAGAGAVQVSRDLAAITLDDGPRRFLYPEATLGSHFAEAALLVRHREALGVEVVTIDHQGWDTHFVEEDALAANASDLAHCLHTFSQDVGDAWKDITVVVLTEFGRRAYENVSRGTDHGRASIAMVAGGGLGRAPVVGRWPSLAEESLEGPGDIPVVTDYRTVLWDVLASRLHNERAADVFPGAPPPT